MGGLHPDPNLTDPTPVALHATTIAAGGRAALIRGASGAGKSDLALRCLALGVNPLIPHPTSLVSDDQTLILRQGGRLLASAPDAIAGLLEVRGIGIMNLPDVTSPPMIPLVLVVESLPSGQTGERLPDPWPMVSILGVELPLLKLDFYAGSAPIRLLLALHSVRLPATG